MYEQDMAALYKVAEIEIIYKSRIPNKDRVKVDFPTTAYNVLKNAWDNNKIELVEQFKILLLDRRNSCIGIADIATGGISACIVDPKVVFATALKAKASGIVLAHNHPSGNLKPSKEDISLTRRLFECGKMLDIAVVEHIILTADGYYSMAHNGLMPS